MNDKVTIVDDKTQKINEENKVEKEVEETNTMQNDVVEQKKTKASPFLTNTVPKKEEVTEEKEINTSEIAIKQEEFLKKNLKDKSLFEAKCKLFYFSNKTEEFEERGEGKLLLTESIEKGMVKVTMVRDHIMRLGCNHYINPRFKALLNKKVEFGWVWGTTGDTVENDLERSPNQIFLVVFNNDEDSKKFKETYDLGRETNEKVLKAAKA